MKELIVFYNILTKNVKPVGMFKLDRELPNSFSILNRVSELEQKYGVKHAVLPITDFDKIDDPRFFQIDDNSGFSLVRRPQVEIDAIVEKDALRAERSDNALTKIQTQIAPIVKQINDLSSATAWRTGEVNTVEALDKTILAVSLLYRALYAKRDELFGNNE